MLETHLTAVIIEPNVNLVVPYRYLEGAYKLQRYSSVEQAYSILAETQPDLVCLSASIDELKMIHLLEKLKNITKQKLIPLVIVVDFSNRINFVPGVSWGGKIGVVDSYANEQQFTAVLDRILSLVL